MTALLEKKAIQRFENTKNDIVPSLVLVNHGAKVLKSLKTIKNTELKDNSSFHNEFVNLRFVLNQLLKNPESKKLRILDEFREIRNFLKESVDSLYKIGISQSIFLPILGDLYDVFDLKDVFSRSAIRFEDGGYFLLEDGKIEIKEFKPGLIKNSFFVQRDRNSNQYLTYSNYKLIAEILKAKSEGCIEMDENNLPQLDTGLCDEETNKEKKLFDHQIWDYALEKGLIKVYQPNTQVSQLPVNNVNRVIEKTVDTAVNLPKKSILSNIKNWFKRN